MSKILIVYYSMYGHVHQMAEAVAAGVREVEGCEAIIKRVPETLSPEILGMMGALDAQKKQEQIPVATVDDLAAVDGIIFGSPTRFGSVCGQMRQFLDATGGLWAKGALVGKAGSVFTSSATQHGGQESTILGLHTSLLHHGMVIVGLPYAFAGQMDNSEITGGSPYGASTVAGTQGERTPTANELAGARFQGSHVAGITKRLFR